MKYVKFYPSEIDDTIPEIVSDTNFDGAIEMSDEEYNAYLLTIADKLEMWKNLKEYECIKNGAVYDRRNDTDYINAQKLEEKTKIAQEYKELFNSIDVLYCRKIALGQSNQSAYSTARANLQSELVTKLSEV